MLDDHKPTIAEIYGYGILANAICCICSIGGAVILPCAKRFSRAYHVFLSIFLGLAVGTLFTGAVVHLIPEALGIHIHAHSSNKTESNPESGDDDEAEVHVENYIWYSMIVLLGTYLFYLVEMIMTLVRKKKVHDDDMPNPVVLTVQKSNGEFHKMEEVSETSNHVNESPAAREEKKEKSGITPLALMVIIGDAIHNTADGLALGAAFTSSLAEGVSLTIAIFCHELPHELGDFAVLLNSGMSFCKAVMANLLSSLTAFIGFIIGVQLSTDETAQQWIFAITAGMFLYISLSDMLPELVRLGSRSYTTFIYHNIGIVLGALILVVIAVFEEKIDVH